MQPGAQTEAFENGAHAQAFSMEQRMGTSDGRIMVRVASGGHGQSAALRVRKGTLVLGGKRGGGVEHLQSIHRQGVEGRLAYTRPHPVVRMRGNGEPALRVDALDDLGRRRVFESVWQPHAKTQQMSFRSGNLRPGDDQKTVHRLAILAE